ncbi:MAG TPA: thymidine phosphorylase [Gaiellales bacterium]|nr:thymidine phosphorylase [Gaiellales bacterium]
MSERRIVDLIARKRDGGELGADEIEAVISPDVPDYQLAAFLMAVVLRGMSERETADLLRAMVDSGTRLDLSAVGRPVADKHSTGGVGDKTTLVVAPLAAACGVPVAKLSGRGLGHTGGTLDKLESIPGLRVDLSPAELVAQVRDVGVAVAGQTADLVPADRRMYHLRDVTATVHSIPLIATSIMSKKVAAGASRLVLDVKVGDGAFMPDVESARSLAEAMRGLGAASGLPTTCMLTGMDEPLGRAVGNALEVAEAEAALRGEGPADLVELCLAAADLMTGMPGAAERALASGEAHAAFRQWIEAQGGDPDAPLPRAPVVEDVPAPRAGWVTRCGALAVGEAAHRLGAGRTRKEDAVDHAVGIVVHAKAGDRVEAWAPLATVHARGRFDAAEIAACFEIGDAPVDPRPVVIELIG